MMNNNNHKNGSNLFALHQNKTLGVPLNCVHESMIPGKWMDSVTGGHEHECEPQESVVGTWITQPIQCRHVLVGGGRIQDHQCWMCGTYFDCCRLHPGRSFVKGEVRRDQRSDPKTQGRTQNYPDLKKAGPIVNSYQAREKTKEAGRQGCGHRGPRRCQWQWQMPMVRHLLVGKARRNL
jgi:hypothetical protein